MGHETEPSTMWQPIVSSNGRGVSDAAGSDGINRRDLLRSALLTGLAATLVGEEVMAQKPSNTPMARNIPAATRGGLLYPLQNQMRNILDLSGIWQFQLDPKKEGEAQEWFNALPAARPIGDITDCCV